MKNLLVAALCLPLLCCNDGGDAYGGDPGVRHADAEASQLREDAAVALAWDDAATEAGTAADAVVPRDAGTSKDAGRPANASDAAVTDASVVADANVAADASGDASASDGSVGGPLYQVQHDALCGRRAADVAETDEAQSDLHRASVAWSSHGGASPLGGVHLQSWCPGL